MGCVVDPNRIVVMGHSYGAFMTSNLLAHCNLFKAGISMSGAYNRTRTPFGFQRKSGFTGRTPSFTTTCPPSPLRRQNQNADHPIRLTGKEYVLLEYMARRKEELITRADIAEHVWDERFNPFSNLIEVYMLRLRRKIDAPFTAKLLQTQRGEGYKLSTRPTTM